MPHPLFWLSCSYHLLQEKQDLPRSGTLEVLHFSDRIDWAVALEIRTGPFPRSSDVTPSCLQQVTLTAVALEEISCYSWLLNASSRCLLTGSRNCARDRDGVGSKSPGAVHTVFSAWSPTELALSLCPGFSHLKPFQLSFCPWIPLLWSSVYVLW